jgi:Ca2+-transporting ATPase
MARPPRSQSEGVINARMWRGIVLVGCIMATVTLFALDAALPGGFVECLVDGTGGLPHAQTMAFTTLMLCQVFNVFNARSDERSALPRLFTNRWLWAALGTSLVAQVAVVYLGPLQRAFVTTPLSLTDWIACTGLASLTLLGRELSKLITRLFVRPDAGAATPAANRSDAAR